MKKNVYNVYLYYHGCINDRIDAGSESEAIEIFRGRVEKMSDEDFLEKAGIMEDGHDAYHIGVTCD